MTTEVSRATAAPFERHNSACSPLGLEPPTDD